MVGTLIVGDRQQEHKAIADVLPGAARSKCPCQRVTTGGAFGKCFENGNTTIGAFEHVTQFPNSFHQWPTGVELKRNRYFALLAVGSMVKLPMLQVSLLRLFQIGRHSFWIVRLWFWRLLFVYENLWSRNIEQLHLFSKFGLSIDIRFSGFMPADSEQV